VSGVAAFLALGGAVAGAETVGVGQQAWWYKSMDLTAAHQVTTGTGAVIGVIDSQIDPDVPELRGQHVVPVRNFCGGSATGKGAAAAHGTSVVVNIAGSGVGTAPGGVGVAGVAPDATVRTYAVEDATSTLSSVNCVGADEAEAVASALVTAAADGARVITTSLGGDDSPVLHDAVNAVLRSGAVLIAATGDGPVDRSVRYPAAYPGVVAVAAVDSAGAPWTGNVIEDRKAFVISAPGADIPTGSFQNGRWSSQVIYSGTSEATPLVAGSLALVAAKYPNATGNQLIQTLIHNPAGNRPFGFDTEYGYGIVSPQKMLAVDPTQYPDVNPLLPAEPSAPPTETPTTAAPAAPDSTPTPAPVAAPKANTDIPPWLLPAGLVFIVASAWASKRWARRS
jgi:subtilisin family serine protease